MTAANTHLNYVSNLAPNPTPNQSSLGVKARSQLWSGEGCTSNLSVFSLLSVAHIFSVWWVHCPSFYSNRVWLFKNLTTLPSFFFEELLIEDCLDCWPQHWIHHVCEMCLCNGPMALVFSASQESDFHEHIRQMSFQREEAGIEVFPIHRPCLGSRGVFASSSWRWLLDPLWFIPLARVPAFCLIPVLLTATSSWGSEA